MESKAGFGYRAHRKLHLFVVGALALSIGGCGSGTTCEQLADALCAQLVECPEMAEPDECSYVQPGHRLGISGAVCEGHFTRDFCGDTTKTEAFLQVGLDAAGQAQCMPHEGENALMLPAAGEGLLDCGAGPRQD